MYVNPVSVATREVLGTVPALVHTGECRGRGCEGGCGPSPLTPSPPILVAEGAAASHHSDDGGSTPTHLDLYMNQEVDVVMATEP